MTAKRAKVESLIPNGKVATAGAAISVAVDPSGRFAYVVNGTSVSAYDINPSTGMLTTNDNAITVESNIATLSIQSSVTVDPSGRFAYVLTNTSSAFLYAITASGALTPVDKPIFKGIARSIAINPIGRFAYVTNPFEGNISNYNIKTFQLKDAMPSPLEGIFLNLLGTSYIGDVSNFPEAATFILVDPSGKAAYVLSTSDHIWVCEITQNGTLQRQ